jgi:hypothetical protein
MIVRYFALKFSPKPVSALQSFGFLSIILQQILGIEKRTLTQEIKTSLLT